MIQGGRKPDRLRRLNPALPLMVNLLQQNWRRSPETAPTNIMLAQILKFRSFD
jgi:hypothetical protein